MLWTSAAVNSYNRDTGSSEGLNLPTLSPQYSQRRYPNGELLQAKLADWGQARWPVLLQSVISMFDQPGYGDFI